MPLGLSRLDVGHACYDTVLSWIMLPSVSQDVGLKPQYQLISQYLPSSWRRQKLSSQTGSHLRLWLLPGVQGGRSKALANIMGNTFKPTESDCGGLKEASPRVKRSRNTGFYPAASTHPPSVVQFMFAPSIKTAFMCHSVHNFNSVWDFFSFRILCENFPSSMLFWSAAFVKD